MLGLLSFLPTQISSAKDSMMFFSPIFCCAIFSRPFSYSITPPGLSLSFPFCLFLPVFLSLFFPLFFAQLITCSHTNFLLHINLFLFCHFANIVLIRYPSIPDSFGLSKGIKGSQSKVRKENDMKLIYIYIIYI